MDVRAALWSQVPVALLLFGQMAFGAGPAFDVASVKPSKSDGVVASNFTLGPGDRYIPNGGLFSATGLPLITYISFAYRMMGSDMQYLLPQLPGWVTTERFDIQARAEGNPGKSEMRLMMRALLAERFGLAVHNETREAPVLALVLVKPGKTGPQLRAHREEPPCPSDIMQPPVPTSDGFPLLCVGLLDVPPQVPGRRRVGARRTTLQFIAASLDGLEDLGRPVVDQTGLEGNFDFAIEWDAAPDSPGPSFQEALREQLGLKLEARKGPFEVIVLDHVQRPSVN